MNRSELLAQLETRLGSRGAAVAALHSVLDEIQRAVAVGDRVTLTGFGTFERVERPARTGRNPRTGATLQIPASATPRFRPGSVLRAAVADSARAVPAAVSDGAATVTGERPAKKSAEPAKGKSAKAKPAKAAKPGKAKKGKKK